MAAAEKVLAFAVALSFVSTGFLLVSLLTDKWFVIDATKYIIHCREDKLLEQLYPWQDIYSDITAEKDSDEDDVSYSGESKAQTTQISLGNQTEAWEYNKTDRGYSDWPGLPLLSPSSKQEPIPLLQRIRRVDIKRPIPSRKRHRPKQIPGISDASRVRRNAVNAGSRRAEEDRKFDQKIVAWNRLVRDLRYNLFGFGGRDVSFDRRQHTSPGSARNNECVNEMKKSIKRDTVIKKCLFAVPDCKKRQFSTFTGLWQTCLADDGTTFLSKIVKHGNITRCSPVQYADLMMRYLPAGLKAGEVEGVFQEEWKTLHLRRILVSFICMAALVQIFGLILVIGGWILHRGFIIYAGGLVLVMSGTFQLLAIGTSILLFEVELNRSPVEVYKFPEGVTQEFGHSAHALWLSAGFAVMAGLLCAFATTLSSQAKSRQEIFMNGNVNAQIPRCEDSSTIRTSEERANLVVNISSNVAKTRVQHETKSVDIETNVVDPKVHLTTVRRKELRRQSKTYSEPNLSHASTTLNIPTDRGRSPTRKSHPVSPLATVPTRQGSIKYRNDAPDRADSGEFGERNSESGHNSVTEGALNELTSEGTIGNTQSRILRQGLRYSHSLDVPSKSCDHKTSLSCQATVDISQRLRHARYARRTSHSCEEAATRVQNILRGAHLHEERRTHSLPRPMKRHTPLSDLSGVGGQNTLKDHRKLFLQRQGLRGGSFESCSPAKGRYATLERHHSEDSSAVCQRFVHPLVARWWNDSGRWSRSLDDGQRIAACLSRDSSTRSHALAREGTLDSVKECAESSDSTPSERGSSPDEEKNKT